MHPKLISRRTALRKTAAFTATAAIGASFEQSTRAHEGHSSRKFFTYVGTYTGPRSKGIYLFKFDPGHGTLEPLGVAAELSSPSFLAVHPSKPLLYAINEVDKFEGKPTGAVTAFKVDRKTGSLTLLNQVSAGGPGPCHVSVDRTGRCVLVANYGGGSVASYQILPDGGLRGPVSFIQHTGSSVNPSRQKEPHAHSINVSPNNRFAYAADLGLDKILIYKLDAKKATLTPNSITHASLAPGSGPRHFAFHPSGRHAYVINEIVCTVTAFAHNSRTGALREIQTVSTLPAGEAMKPAYSTAEIVAHPNGKLLFGSNRGHHTIAGFQVREDGSLTPAGHTPTQGRTPRNFAIDPTGSHLFAANQGTDNLVVFSIDGTSGALSPTGITAGVPSPVCVRFIASV